MRIGIFFLGGMGGIVTHGIELCNILSRKGHEVHFFSTHDFQHSEEIVFHKIPYTADWGFMQAYDARHTPALNKELKDLDLDVINLELPFFTLDAHIPNIRFPAPVVGTLHQCFKGDTIYDSVLAAYYSMFTRKTLASCDRLIAVSKSVAETLDTRLPYDIVYNGIDTDTFKPGKKKDGYLLFTGRTMFEKGVHHLLLAHQLLRKHNDLPLHMVGDGPLAPIVRRMPGVDFLGMVPKHRLVEQYQRATLGIFPSLWREAGSRVLLECMACGTPAVAYRTGAMPEIIDDGVDGFLCPKDPLRLKASIEAALETDLPAMGRRARAKIEKSFSLETMYKGTIKAFKQA